MNISPYDFNGTAKTCAGCGQPFVVRAGQSEAIVGEDGRLYCYATLCEPDSIPSGKLRLAARRPTLHARNRPISRPRARVRFGGMLSGERMAQRP
jgi:hypothetical protein